MVSQPTGDDAYSVVRTERMRLASGRRLAALDDLKGGRHRPGQLSSSRAAGLDLRVQDGQDGDKPGGDGRVPVTPIGTGSTPQAATSRACSEAG